MYDQLFIRNIGIVSEEDQERLRNSTIGIAGTGGVGGQFAYNMARLGVGRIKLSDPETFDYSNVNRQFGATTNTIGAKKADVVADECKKINPNLEIMISYGITVDNVEDFIRGCNFVSDSIEIFSLWERLALHKIAREYDLPVSFAPALGFGSALFVFDPRGMTFEEFFEVPSDPDKLRGWMYPSHKIKPGEQNYMVPNTWKKVRDRLMDPPTTIIGIQGSAILSAMAAIKNILGKGKQVYVPEVIHVDHMDMTYEIIKHPN